jgi:hypothetical protein
MILTIKVNGLKPQNKIASGGIKHRKYSMWIFPYITWLTSSNEALVIADL